MIGHEDDGGFEPRFLPPQAPEQALQGAIHGGDIEVVEPAAELNRPVDLLASRRRIVENRKGARDRFLRRRIPVRRVRIEVVKPEELPIAAGPIETSEGRVGDGLPLRIETIPRDLDSLPFVRSVPASELFIEGVEPLREAEPAPDGERGHDRGRAKPRTLEHLGDGRDLLVEDLTVARHPVLPRMECREERRVRWLRVRRRRVASVERESGARQRECQRHRRGPASPPREAVVAQGVDRDQDDPQPARPIAARQRGPDQRRARKERCRQAAAARSCAADVTTPPAARPRCKRGGRRHRRYEIVSAQSQTLRQ